MRFSHIIIFVVSSLLAQPVVGQDASPSWWVPSDSLNPLKYRTALIGSIGTYSAFALGLNQLWYAEYEQTSFQFYNDWCEWENMDKFGHAYNGYFQSHLIYQGARWTGLSENASIWYGIGGSLLFQSTIEVMDGFSKEWGFSIPDMGFNLLGTGLFAFQQKYWGEQRVKVKLSAFPVSYSETDIIGSKGTNTTRAHRAEDLFTDALASQILKDYNAQIIWASFHPNPSSAPKYWPQWLNLAVGYGASNMYGGYENEWDIGDEKFIISDIRQQQYYLSLDIDLDRIKVKNPFLKSVLSILNIIKVPLPALEYNSELGFRGHWLR